MLVAWLTGQGVYVRAGCFWNTLERFKMACAETHGTTGPYAEEYAAAVVLIETHARLWTPTAVETAAA